MNENRRPDVVYIVSPSPYDLSASRAYLGGAERYLLELCQLIRSKGYEVEVFQPASEPFLHFFHGIPVFGLPTSGGLVDFSREFHTRVVPAALHVYLAPFLAEDFAFSPSIGISHGVYWDDPVLQKWDRSYQITTHRICQAVRNLTLLVSVDANTINSIRSMDWALAQKCTRIPNFVDTTQFAPRPKPANVARPVVLFPRRLTPARGLNLLEPITRLVLYARPDTLFLLVGQPEDPETQATAEKLRANFPENVELATYPLEEMAKAYDSADLVIIPTTSAEGTSLSCLEAMASGKAVVATHVGGLAELIVDKVTGLLVDPTPEAIASGILHLISNPDLKEALAKNARQAALAFSIDSWRKRWLEVLEAFLVNPPQQPPRHFFLLHGLEDQAAPGQALAAAALAQALARAGMRVALERGRVFSCEAPHKFSVPRGFKMSFPGANTLGLRPPEGSGNEPAWWTVGIGTLNAGTLEVLRLPGGKHSRLTLPLLPLQLETAQALPLSVLEKKKDRVGILGDFRTGNWSDLFSQLPKNRTVGWALAGPGAENVAAVFQELVGSEPFLLPDLLDHEIVTLINQCSCIMAPAFSDDEHYWAETIALTAMQLGIPAVLNFEPSHKLGVLCFFATQPKALAQVLCSALAASQAKRKDLDAGFEKGPCLSSDLFLKLQRLLSHKVRPSFISASQPPKEPQIEILAAGSKGDQPHFTIRDAVRRLEAELVFLRSQLADVRKEALEKEAKLLELSKIYQGLVHQYGERQREVERLAKDNQILATQSADWVAKYQQLLKQYSERQAEVEKLIGETNQLRQEVAEWSARHEQLVRQYGERQAEVERLAQTLKEIISTRWFRAASLYWKVRSKLRSGFARHTRPKQRAPESLTAAAPQTATRTSPEDTHEPSPGPSSSAGYPAKFDVLCLPIIDWDFRFQRPQQLALQFARQGQRVFYLSQKFRTLGAPFTLVPKADGVWEVSLRGPTRNVYQDTMDEEAAAAYFEAVDALRREQRLGATAVVVQLPFWWPLARLLRERYGWPVIYDCMDYHAGFSTNRQEMLKQEDELLAGSSLVVVPSLFLKEQADKHNTRVALVPNACDYQHFAGVTFRACKNPPVIGYYGAIADWFDSDLVADLAELRPEWRFLLVGSTFTADTKRLSRLPNVELVGEKPYSEIPQWVAQMDCLVIPFKRTPLTDATNPVKFFEIMAAGKPLVSVPLPELLPFGEYVRFAETAQSFAQQIELALAEEKPALLLKRREFAINHTWEKRFENLAAETVRAFPKASIVVVTYNNLHLTQQCLDSILARTEWPSYELFVVDNSSTDGTPEYLTDLAQKDPRVRVILNSENRGFAAANNQALREAQGEFIVLLNNDTVVTRGWLSGLIRHLCAHPDFGLVGPVTNWIGNEAQISVGYQRLEDMPQWADEYTRAHDGEFFDITVAALFCAAMRRDTFLRVGELDERFAIGMFEDDDYALRIREAGLRVVCVEDVFVHHHGKAAFKKMPNSQYQELFERNKRLFEAKWGKPWVPHRYRSQ